ncbi:uncharacterized protein LOC123537463 [Mercenaria mercenaria]|uniref:uncharacterized protein LOC123537463 n=1 Tax=Mercenaria mercenaria TaxID=6596 RepID=UPI001E1D2CF3|nr:uncharacterized protein LOC123537463 [Mercenaria mercenaria]
MQQGQGGDSSDVEGQAVYAGGSERRHGAEEVNSDVSPKPGGSKALKGSGYRLGDGERQKTAVQKRKMVKTTPGSNKRRRIVVEEEDGNVENEFGDEEGDDGNEDAWSGDDLLMDAIEIFKMKLKGSLKKFAEDVKKEIDKYTRAMADLVRNTEARGKQGEQFF